ncbi:MAG: 3-dehydroquinate synthase [Actinobacteria bacterium]|nr:3-dehydroquinate synthase [Actinomycetota bacterium]MBU1495023.1 3-dehydroquinate synthase [Actinomycetota bacterium]
MAQRLTCGTTQVVLGRSLLAPADILPERERASVAVVAQPATARLARDFARAAVRAGLRSEVRVLPDGEAAKDLGVVAELYEWLIGMSVARSDTLVAFGGGSLTDAAGFAAATYLRGIEVVYVATTLLAAVDAAIGGKTGVNLGAKNLVGSFRHPARVVIDVDVLDRLPAAVKRGGMSEALKAGLIGDEALVGLLERDGMEADLEEVVGRAVAVKAAVVGKDFEEQGERVHLNYGHTVGHGVEVAGGIGHGPAVAIGMVAAGRASALERGFEGEDRQRAAIARLGLPVAAPGLDRMAVLALMAADKKRDAGGLRMVLLERIGAPTVAHVGSATVEAALTAVEIA